MFRVIAIDPGTSYTGLVYMDETQIHACRTIVGRTPVKSDQYQLRTRAAEIAREISNWIADKPHEAVIIEGFTQFGQRNNAFTFQTPYLCGYLQRELDGENLIIQTSHDVFGNTRGSLCQGCRTKEDYKRAKEYAISNFIGRDLVTNDHTRSAACHGVYYLKGVLRANR